MNGSLVVGRHHLGSTSPDSGVIKLSISVLILTLKEVNLPGCLESVAWSDDIVVFDSFSTDGTVEIARAVGARSSVYKDVAPWIVVGGNPAKFIKQRILKTDTHCG